MNVLVACACILQLSAPGCRTPNQSTALGQELEIQVQGIDRTYRSFIPPSAEKAKKAPLLFVFHGGAGDAKRAQKHFSFDKQAREHGFIVVYPEAIDGHWNDGRMGEKFASQDSKIDDVAYFRAVLAKVKIAHKIDEERIYAMGASNGGMFVQRLAVEETATFAAVASTISSLPKPLKQGFAPKAPLSVLFMSGTEDPIVPFDGGEVVFHLFGGNKKRRWEKSRGQVLPVREAAKLWVAHNKIKAPEQDVLLPDADTSDDCRIRRRLWQDKGSQAPAVLLYEIRGGGHTLPQLKSRVSKRVIGRTCEDINAQEVIWQFLADKKRTKPKAEKPSTK